MKEKAIEALQELLEETKNIRDSYSLTSWKDKTTNLVIRIYGRDGEPIKQVSAFKYYEGISNFNEIQGRAKALLTGLIKDIERFDVPQLINRAQEEKSLHINITQTQNQETKVSLQVFIEAIRDELTGSQQKELQQIIDEPDEDTPTKKSRIIDKLKSFGSDVASNIVASVLTNPGL